jgi:hypothetical protein
MNLQKPNNKKKGVDDFIRYSNLGFEMVAIIAIGTFAGYKIDDWMKNEFRGFTLGLLIVSVVLSIFYGVRNLLKK